MGKYLKLFNEMSQYETFKGSEEYILPNVSFVENSEIVLFNPLQYIKNGVILAKFNATDDNKLAIANTSNIKSLKINGVEVSFTQQTYYFDEIGEYDVEIELIDNSLINGVVWDDNYNLISNPMFTDVNNWIGACLTSIVIPDSVTTIGDGAFNNCYKLTSIIIPDSVTTIGEGAFNNCYKLTSIIIPDSVTSIGSFAFQSCSGLTSITIPDSVTSIGESAFGDCYGLTDIHIGSGVTTIGREAFYECSSLTSITIPDSVTTIGEGAFSDCYGLTDIRIGSGVTTISSSAFMECHNLTSITCYAIAAPTIDSNTFSGIARYGTLKVLVGSDYSSWMSTDSHYLGYYNWSVEYFENILLPDDFEDSVIMTSESNPRAMEVCYNQGWAKNPNEMLASEAYMVTNIGTAFSDGWFESGEWSNPEMLELKSFDEFQYFVNVKTLSPLAFNAVSNMETIVLPPNLITIGDSAFQYCYKLKNIVIPDSVTTIGEYAFYMEDFEEYGYEYKSTLSSITLGSGVTTIGNSAFYGCTSLTSIVIPDSVTNIGNGAFGGCTGITSIVIPDLVTNIGSSTFSYCSSLTSIVIPDSVTNIGSAAFSHCSSLTSIIIPDLVTNIGSSAFSECTGLTSIVIPDLVTNIDYGTFYGCSGLTSVVIPDSVTNIGSSAFYGCTGLTSIVIPDSVTTIGDTAFYDCSSLNEITCLAPTAPSAYSTTFRNVARNGILKVLTGSNYSSWMRTSKYNLGYYNWSVEYI